MIVLVPTLAERRLLFPDLDARADVLPGGDGPDGEPVRVLTCGFGLALAGARAGVHFGRLPDRSALLVGLAGTYDPGLLPVGAVFAADRVELSGIGLGEAGGDASLEAASGPLAGETLGGAPASPDVPPGFPRTAGLLSAATCAASAEEAALRAARHAGCLAEDMEAYAVLAAARAAGKSLAVVRAVSNVAGCRDHARWQVEAAADALRREVGRLIGTARAR